MNTRKRLSQPEFFKVGKLLETIAVDGKVDMVPSAIVNLVKADLELDICPKTLRKAAAAANVEIGREPYKARKGSLKERVENLESRLAQLEKSLGVTPELL